MSILHYSKWQGLIFKSAKFLLNEKEIKNSTINILKNANGI